MRAPFFKNTEKEHHKMDKPDLSQNIFELSIKKAQYIKKAQEAVGQ